MYSSTWKTLIFKRYNGACIKISHGKLRNEAVINVKNDKTWQLLMLGKTVLQEKTWLKCQHLYRHANEHWISI